MALGENVGKSKGAAPAKSTARGDRHRPQDRERREIEHQELVPNDRPVVSVDATGIVGDVHRAHVQQIVCSVDSSVHGPIPVLVGGLRKVIRDRARQPTEAVVQTVAGLDRDAVSKEPESGQHADRVRRARERVAEEPEAAPVAQIDRVRAVGTVPGRAARVEQ